MLELILRWLVLGLLQCVFVIAAAPFILVIATPIILVRAWILAARNQQRFKFAVLDGYDSVWDGLVAAFMWPFYSDIDRIETARRRSSNQTLEPTADRRTERQKDES
jgi:hypothetical protein